MKKINNNFKKKQNNFFNDKPNERKEQMKKKNLNPPISTLIKGGLGYSIVLQR